MTLTLFDVEVDLAGVTVGDCKMELTSPTGEVRSVGCTTENGKVVGSFHPSGTGECIYRVYEKCIKINRKNVWFVYFTGGLTNLIFDESLQRCVLPLLLNECIFLVFNERKRVLAPRS